MPKTTKKIKPKCARDPGMTLMEESMKRILTITLLAMMLLGMLAMTACKPKPEVEPTEEIMTEETLQDNTEALQENTEAVQENTQEAEVTK